MAVPINPRHLKRYGQIASLLVKYGRSDLVRQSGLEAVIEEPPDGPVDQPEAEELAADLEAMGPTFIKLGQLLSSRVDLLPDPYTDALARLQDEIEPFPFSDVERILNEELAIRPSRAFLELDPTPLAAASLGQVHRARLPGGRHVAVKVQRPGIREEVAHDLEALGEIAAFLDDHTEVGRRYRFERILDELRRSLFHELDYRREAANLTRLGDSLAEFDRIVVPCPIEGYVTSRVLTMEYVEGRSIRDVGPLARLEMNGQDLAEQLFRAYLQQVLVDGFFHADPHPGNVFLTTDLRLALIDVGMVGLLGPEMQDSVVRLLLAMSEGRGRDVAETAMELGERTRDFDAAAFLEEINGLVLDYASAPAAELQIGRLVLETTRAAAENGLLIPPQFTLLGKTLLNLDQVGRLLDPEFEPNAAIQRNAADLMRQRVLKSASPGNLFNSLLETNEFVQRLPRRLNRVLDAVSEREFEVRIRIANDNLIMDGLQKIANRIAAGAVLAALILAAALLMRVETAFRIVGYPGLAVILFLAAVAGGIILVIDVFTHDRWTRKDPPRG